MKNPGFAACGVCSVLAHSFGGGCQIFQPWLGSRENHGSPREGERKGLRPRSKRKPAPDLPEGLEVRLQRRLVHALRQATDEHLAAAGAQRGGGEGQEMKRLDRTSNKI